jgi:hypothetical protein
VVLQDVDGRAAVLLDVRRHLLFPELDLRPFVDEDEREFDVAQVLDGNDHVVEDGNVFAVKTEQALERDERPYGDAKGQEVRVGFDTPELGHQTADEGREGLREADVATVTNGVAKTHSLVLLL